MIQPKSNFGSHRAHDALRPTMTNDQEQPASKDDCVVHDHPVSPEEVGRYSVERDPAAEQDIANYVHSQAGDENVRHVERVKTEHVLGEPYEIWDVTTDKSRWWVISNMTNLYSQQHFPSLDYTLSFHVGLMMRMRSRPKGADAAESDPFDEVYRRQEQAKGHFDRAVEAVDYQSVGMQLRECLITLIGVLRRRISLPPDTDEPQGANFVSWTEVMLNQLCPGAPNSDLRSYMNGVSKKTWQLVNWLTHSQNANKTASLIAIEGSDQIVGNFVILLMMGRTDKSEICPQCASKNIRTHFDINVDPDGSYFDTCGECGWTNHPAATEQ